MLTLFIRTIIIYLFMFVIMRLMGKRQLSDMQPFDLVVTLLIANLASVPVSDSTACIRRCDDTWAFYHAEARFPYLAQE